MSEQEFILPSGNQICIVVKDLDKAIKTLSTTLDIKPWRTFDAEWSKEEMTVGNPQSIRCAFADFGAIELEVAQPIKGNGVFMQFLETKGEGIHHIAVDVASIEKTAARLAERGIGIVQWGWKGSIGHAFIDPEKTCGILFELLQRRGRVGPKRG